MRIMTRVGGLESVCYYGEHVEIHQGNVQTTIELRSGAKTMEGS